VESSSSGGGGGGPPAWGEAPRWPYCYGCLRHLPSRLVAAGGLALRCPGCVQLFCFNCDVYVHAQLHNCPGCESGAGAGGGGGGGGPDGGRDAMRVD